jgi:hypothetical protein
MSQARRHDEIAELLLADDLVEIARGFDIAAARCGDAELAAAWRRAAAVFRQPGGGRPPLDDASGLIEVQRLVSQGLSLRSAAHRVARQTNPHCVDATAARLRRKYAAAQINT